MSDTLKRIAEIALRLSNSQENYRSVVDKSVALALASFAGCIREALAEQGGERTADRREWTETDADCAHARLRNERLASYSKPAPSADLVERAQLHINLLSAWLANLSATQKPESQLYRDYASFVRTFSGMMAAIEAKDAEIARLTTPVGDDEVRDAVEYLRDAQKDQPFHRYDDHAALLERLARERNQARDAAIMNGESATAQSERADTWKMRAEEVERERAEVEKQLFAANQDKMALEAKLAKSEQERGFQERRANLAVEVRQSAERRLDTAVKALEEIEQNDFYYTRNGNEGGGKFAYIAANALASIKAPS